MRRGEKRFLYVLVGVFLLYIVVSTLAPEPVDWTITFEHKDKNPFGAFILTERSEDLFDTSFQVSNKTVSELSEVNNLLILANDLQMERTDIHRLFTMLDSGAHIFLAANRLSYALQDTLAVAVSTSFHVLDQSIFESATSTLVLSDSGNFQYPLGLITNHFESSEIDSTWEVSATLDKSPTLISKKIGQGKLTLCTTPLVFTNFGLLYDDNYQAAAHMLTLLPPQPTHYTQYYQLGRREATTPFRFFLRRPPLRRSLYLGLVLIVFFLVLSSRRKQRPIPVIVPPKNTTAIFIKTLGALFYREKNHTRAASRLVNHFLREIKERYYLRVEYTERFYQNLSAKSGIAVNDVIKTFELIQVVKAGREVDEHTLMILTKHIEQFS